MKGHLARGIYSFNVDLADRCIRDQRLDGEEADLIS